MNENQDINHFDLVLRNIKIFKQNNWKCLDIAIKNGKICNMSETGSKTWQAIKTIKFSDTYASSGWIDLHTHLLSLRHGGIGTRADRIGLASGVTALLDVGTVGTRNFLNLHEKVILKSETPVFSFINIKSAGIRPWNVGRNKSPDDDLDAMAELASRYPEYIKGIKITASKEHMLDSDPLYYMIKAREAGDRLQIPVMVHIGRTPPSLSELLPLMKSGDILTHCFRNGPHNILDRDGRVRDDVLEAKSRGIRFDIGHGIRSFSFTVAEKALEQGFDEFTISSDLYMLSTHYLARNFANVLSKFMAIGMKLEHIMETCSEKAAPILGLDRGIEEGKPANITIFRIQHGRFEFKDCWGQKRTGSKRIVPQAALLEGKLYQCS